MEKNTCKICGSPLLVTFAHTAKCGNCGVLLYYPYPGDDSEPLSDGGEKCWQTREQALAWYSKSSFFNHSNFTNMLRFTMNESDKDKKLDILDYGGGGGQFALVCKSHFPEATVYITDISDEALLEEWAASNTQIPFNTFAKDKTRFDFIFMNDVFEHVSDPVFVLKQMSEKLKPDGRVFIDTPKQFWIYPVAKILSKSLYAKILRGTVSTAHLQIWSKSSFNKALDESGLSINKYEEISEYTMPADFYMKNMGIANPILKLAGHIFIELQSSWQKIKSRACYQSNTLYSNNASGIGGEYRAH